MSPLGARGDQARLIAAQMAVAFSDAFALMRQGAGVVDLKKALKSAQTAQDYVIEGVTLPSSTVLTNVRVDSDDDQRRLESLLKASGQSPKAHAPPAEEGPLLRDVAMVHLQDLVREKLEAKTITESKPSTSPRNWPAVALNAPNHNHKKFDRTEMFSAFIKLSSMKSDFSPLSSNFSVSDARVTRRSPWA